jgi:hypothetical protein
MSVSRAMKYIETPVKPHMSVKTQIKTRQERNINNMKTRHIVLFLLKRYNFEILAFLVIVQLFYIVIR